MTGTLIYNELIERPDIRKDYGQLYGGLHCGDCFQYEGETEPVRLEYDHEAREWCLFRGERREPIRYNLTVTI